MNINNISPEVQFEQDTRLHVQKVQENLGKVVKDLIDRSIHHDDSKFQDPERASFIEYTPKLATCTYGSEEYEGYREAIKPALNHHYSNNSHHPEHWKNGINDMTLIDLIEMFADWKAASERHNDGNIHKSIEKNKDRFAMSEQLAKIFENTAKWFEAQK